jgi:glycosyltransferase involved in cell wall biosynthesis
MPKVTVALLTYNRIEFLKQAIEAILSQTYEDFELLIMDNGSTSETYELIKNFLSSKVKYLKNPINYREYVNEAFTLGSGEYLIITHDDDMMMPSLLENQVRILDNNLDIILVAANTVLIDRYGNILKRKAEKINKDIIWAKGEFINDFILNGIGISCPTVMFRRAVFNKFQLSYDYRSGPAADLFLWFKTNLLDYKMCLLNTPMYRYRIHNEQDSLISGVEMEFTIYDTLLDFLEKNGFTKLIPTLRVKRLSTIFDIIIISYYKGIINYDSFITHITRLRSLGFRFRSLRLKTIAKFIIKFSKDKILNVDK